MNTSYLVNIVANDFKDGASIFEPFQLESRAGVAASLANGVKKVVNGVAGLVVSEPVLA
jgi:methylenetetrahydrofolate reductase (NADPH)